MSESIGRQYLRSGWTRTIDITSALWLCLAEPTAIAASTSPLVACQCINANQYDKYVININLSDEGGIANCRVHRVKNQY